MSAFTDMFREHQAHANSRTVKFTAMNRIPVTS